VVIVDEGISLGDAIEGVREGVVDPLGATDEVAVPIFEIL
jgi:putative transposon-encoded protein